MLNNLIIYQLDFFIVIIGLYFCLKIIITDRHKQQVIKRFPDYSAILQLNMEKSYNIIHKEKILIYSLEASRVPEEHINVASKDFVRLVIKFLGPHLYKEYLFLYGNYETFVFTLLDYFSSKYEEDEIRKQSIDDMMEANQEINK